MKSLWTIEAKKLFSTQAQSANVMNAVQNNAGGVCDGRCSSVEAIAACLEALMLPTDTNSKLDVRY